MSFCSDVKNELSLIKTQKCCMPALTYGFMLFSRYFSYKKIGMQTANPNMAYLYSELIHKVYGIDIEVASGGQKVATYRVDVPDDTDRLKILASVDFDDGTKVIDYSLLDKNCCRAAFVRGVFFACGNISDPNNEYRAEFLVKNKDLADHLYEMLIGFGVKVMRSKRGSAEVIYIKNSEVIEDLLTLIGAPRKSLDLMDTKIIKSVKNNINRVRNCEDANISKTVEASIKQRTAIEYLENTGRLYSLPQELIDVAKLRKNNPEATLKELCKLSAESISLSGLNHRLKKIIEIYNDMTK